MSTSCQQLDFAGATQKEIPESQTADRSSDDMVDIPVNVTGSYLACAIRKDVKENEPGLQLGCRLNDPETHQKLDLGSYANNVSWLIEPIESAEIEILQNHSIWHAFYFFPTANRNEAYQQLGDARIIVNLEMNRQTIRIESRAEDSLQPIENFDDRDAPLVIERGIAPETPARL